MIALKDLRKSTLDQTKPFIGNTSINSKTIYIMKQALQAHVNTIADGWPPITVDLAVRKDYPTAVVVFLWCGINGRNIDLMVDEPDVIGPTEVPTTTVHGEKMKVHFGTDYTVEGVDAEADKIVMELAGIPTHVRESNLAELQAKNPVLYAIVKKRMESLQYSLQLLGKSQDMAAENSLTNLTPSKEPLSDPKYDGFKRKVKEAFDNATKLYSGKDVSPGRYAGVIKKVQDAVDEMVKEAGIDIYLFVGLFPTKDALTFKLRTGSRYIDLTVPLTADELFLKFNQSLQAEIDHINKQQCNYTIKTNGECIGKLHAPSWMIDRIVQQVRMETNNRHIDWGYSSAMGYIWCLGTPEQINAARDAYRLCLPKVLL